MGEAIFVLAILMSLLIVCAVLEVMIPYKKESKYIKMEIARACTRNEKIHWQHELKRLRKRYVPFLYLFDKKKK